MVGVMEDVFDQLDGKQLAGVFSLSLDYLAEAAAPNVLHHIVVLLYVLPDFGQL